MGMRLKTQEPMVMEVTRTRTRARVKSRTRWRKRTTRSAGEVKLAVATDEAAAVLVSDTAKMIMHMTSMDAAMILIRIVLRAESALMREISGAFRRGARRGERGAPLLYSVLRGTVRTKVTMATLLRQR